ncbi:hypothetical protein HCJ76_33725 [Streptomyces sp. MC1]|uniref:hypothetical protein n=1 Tax=unclassified Streptomyces TaxID=2593676 RepID=UPI0004BD3156|nr:MULTISPECIES: hypothetical protein [unclassified Streptomyces]KOV92026.1 hypothetical protein ADL02_12250 [Streptomyces sp. NRRL WC-3723]MBG7702886.1 hypothetical protein [Streptomyces sp. MC1]
MSTARHFLLDIPDLWDQADLSGEELARIRARALAATDDPREQARINDMFRQGRDVTRAARRHGALLAAGTATLYADGLFMAYGMVFAVTTPEGQELTLPVLSAQLGVSTATGVAPKDRVITSVDLPHAGKAARVTGTETTRLTGDIDVRLLTMHTMVPVPGTADDFLVVTLASPNLPLKEEVYDLFDAITSTFRFVAADGRQAVAAGPAAG